MNLENKNIIITGASEGIGRSIAIKLAETGANVALIARNEEKLKEVQNEIGEKAKIFVGDLRDVGSLENAFEEIKEQYLEIHGLINNAGIWQKKGQLDDATKEEINDVLLTNLVGLIQFTRMVLPELRKASSAALINISSKSGVEAQADQSVYSASKWGVRGFTDVLKVDLKGTNIRVAGVYQSGTNTRIFKKVGDDQVPIEKFTKPDDLAEVIVFMLSRPDKIWLNEVRVNY